LLYGESVFVQTAGRRQPEDKTQRIAVFLNGWHYSQELVCRDRELAAMSSGLNNVDLFSGYGDTGYATKCLRYFQ
jgi:hypothetical protein